MGLDMYAYVAAKAGQQAEYWNTAKFDPEAREYISPVSKPRELAYWRKHPNLHGWFHALWIRKGEPGWNSSTDPTFNGIELELTFEDLDILEQDILEGNLPSTSGFFFGNDADEYYQEDDLKFIREARAELFMGLKVFYNSSW
jgi:hypothetical protein